MLRKSYSSVPVGGGECGGIPCARSEQWRLPPGHLRQRSDTPRVPDWGAHEVQERVQVQDCLRRAADSDGATT